MPLPKPSKKSKISKSDWISKCMSSDTVQREFKGQEQRLGYCYSAWKQVKGSKGVNASINFINNDETIIADAEVIENLIPDKIFLLDKAKELSTEERKEISDKDFVIPSNRSFPITDCKSVMNAVHSFGRSKSGISYEDFKKRLISIVKRKGLTHCLPQTIKDEKGIK